ncbi:hypothetical protein COV18_04650 [Candidatus Woesearchaeota archaeon CG10_big_fil_rev_8_21_14_0_10_37_12]|nr:MAG: hypothetical protein COV18_04650 [Candidatus Woesearchaeota archaeon CG10_big_fil_rev_8_21_14_0_10_37_12]
MKLASIKAIGFDLDYTLYPQSKDIQEKVADEVAKHLAGAQNLPFDEARKKYEETYAKLKSGKGTLLALGVENAREVMQNCLESAERVDFIEQNAELVKLIEQLKEKVGCVFLITGSRKHLAIPILEKIGLTESHFDHAIYGPDTEGDHLIKFNGTAFAEIERLTGLKPEELCYVGDNPKMDIHPAHARGWKTILVNDKDDKATVCIQDILHIKELI